MKDGNSKNRLGLAKWLTDKENPLHPTGYCEPYWQTIFGRGISDTPAILAQENGRPIPTFSTGWLLTLSKAIGM